MRYLLYTYTLLSLRKVKGKWHGCKSFAPRTANVTDVAQTATNVDSEFPVLIYCRNFFASKQAHRTVDVLSKEKDTSVVKMTASIVKSLQDKHKLTDDPPDACFCTPNLNAPNKKTFALRLISF